MVSVRELPAVTEILPHSGAMVLLGRVTSHARDADAHTGALLAEGRLSGFMPGDGAAGKEA